MAFNHKAYNIDVFWGMHNRNAVDVIDSPLAYVARRNVFRMILYGNQVGFCSQVRFLIYSLYLFPQLLSGPHVHLLRHL